jgi:hypothetical protein
MIFELAKRENCLVQPVAIRYWNHEHDISETTPFIDDDGIFMSIIKLLFERKIHAHVHFLPAINAQDVCRKQMAQQSQLMIQQVLKQPYPTVNTLKNTSRVNTAGVQS